MCTCSSATCTIQTLKKISEDSSPCKDVSADDGLLQGGLEIDDSSTHLARFNWCEDYRWEFYTYRSRARWHLSAHPISPRLKVIIIGSQGDDEGNVKLASITFQFGESIE